MDRRRLLRLSGAALATPFATALAGCGQEDGGDTDASDGGDATPTASPSPTPESTTAPSETADPEPTPTASPTPTATPDSDATPTTSPTPTATATPTATPRDAAQVVAVADGELAFAPDSFEVSVGDTVVWVWHSNGHNVKPSSTPSGSDFSGTAGDDTLYDEGHEFSFTFETPGEYEYHCVPHRSVGMTGSVTVTE